MINASSKMALKLSCLQQTGGDVKRAEELYRFLAEGVDSMPDYPVQPPSTMQQIGNAAGSIFGWVKENQGDIMNAVNFIQQIRGGQAPVVPGAGAVVPGAEIPPLPPIE